MRYRWIGTKLYKTFHINSVKPSLLNLHNQRLGAARFTSTDSRVSYDSSKKKASPRSKTVNFSTYVLSHLTESTSVRNVEMSSIIDEISSEDNRIAVKDKSIKELFRSLIVYKLCSSQWLVNHAPSLISFAEKSHLSTLVYWIIRKTFFAQFCGYVHYKLESIYFSVLSLTIYIL